MKSQQTLPFHAPFLVMFACWFVFFLFFGGGAGGGLGIRYIQVISIDNLKSQAFS